ncbi:MAG: NADH-quinone oxidoreductase subunit L, partial [Acidobacteria bacterium]|nr:NADH-quinone oxidoreductase subunit L [Acidobacteriota bacterium]
THAFFKALLFLGAGSVIHGMHQEQDMLRMGGLKKYLPWTCATMWMATLAIAGVPLLSGFFSKDEILWRAWSNPGGGGWIWVLGVVTAGLTAFYMFRLMFLTFHGEERFAGGSSVSGHGAAESHGSGGSQSAGGGATGGDGAGGVHPHESPWVMVGPLVVLAVLSLVGGYVMVPSWFPVGSQWLEHFLEPVFEHQYMPAAAGHAAHGAGLEIGLTVISVLVAGCGMGLAYRFYLARPEQPARLAARFQGLYQTLYHKYYVDEIYDALVVNRTKDLGNFLSAFDANVVDGLVNFSAAFTRFSAWVSGIFDMHIVDRLVNLVASTVQFFSMVFRRLQTGLVQGYALFILVGILFVLSLYLYIGA